jgi:hypothetical protein
LYHEWWKVKVVYAPRRNTKWRSLNGYSCPAYLNNKTTRITNSKRNYITWLRYTT